MVVDAKLPERPDERPGWLLLRLANSCGTTLWRTATTGTWTLKRLLRAIGVDSPGHSRGARCDRLRLTLCCTDWITARLRLRGNCHHGCKRCNADKPDHLHGLLRGTLRQRGRCDGVPTA